MISPYVIGYTLVTGKRSFMQTTTVYASSKVFAIEKVK
jgi:hypothetical protein